MRLRNVCGPPKRVANTTPPAGLNFAAMALPRTPGAPKSVVMYGSPTPRERATYALPAASVVVATGEVSPKYVEYTNRDPSALIFVRKPAVPGPLTELITAFKTGKSLVAVNPTTTTFPCGSTAMPAGEFTAPRPGEF